MIKGINSDGSKWNIEQYTQIIRAISVSGLRDSLKLILLENEDIDWNEYTPVMRDYSLTHIEVYTNVEDQYYKREKEIFNKYLAELS